MNASASQGGNPNIYTIRGLAKTGWFEFFPVPGSAVTVHIDYEKSISSVSLGSDLPEIPVNYYELLILYGEKLGLRRQKRYDLSLTVDKEFQALKQRLMEDLMRQTTQMPRIKSVREFRYGGQTTTDPVANAFYNNNY